MDTNTQSILFLTDESDQPAGIGLVVTAGGVQYYLTSLQLGPHETRAVDLRQLRDAQVPDFKGNMVPTGTTDGSVSWIRVDNVPVTGRVVVSNDPPAEPEALRLLAPQRGLFATDQNRNRLVMRRDFIHHILNGSEKTHCRKCQTSTATPAEPGELLKPLAAQADAAAATH